MIELQTTWGAADLYTLLEIMAVDAHNDAILNEPRN